MAEAVIVDPLSPKETLLLLDSVKADRLLDVVPADRLRACDAVIVEPFSPKETPFEFEKVIADRLLDVVPALTLMFVSEVATDADAVTTLPLSPNETLFAFENVTEFMLFDVVPALRLMPATEAVRTVEFERPKETPFEFANETVPDSATCVPALIATPVRARLMETMAPWYIRYQPRPPSS